MHWSLLLLGSVLAAPEVRPLPIGTAAPDFALRDHRGALRKLDDWQETQFIVIAFLGSDCPLVKLYTPRLNEIAKEYGSRGVAVIGINANQHDHLRDISRFVKDHAVTFPILKDSDNRVADLYGALRTPE